MAFKEVAGGATIDIKTMKDEPFEGIYVGQKEITTEIGPQVIYRFKQGASVKGVYGFTNLNRAMEAVCEGALVRLTYLGTENVKTKFGMKDVHQVSVMVDEDGGEAPSDIDEDL
jgi:hypothetical protein